MLSRASRLLNREVVICGASRTPIGAFGGGLKTVPAWDLATAVMKETLKRSKLQDLNLIGDVRMGSCMEPHQAMNIARVAALKAGVPDTVPAATMNRVCCSGMEALTSSIFQIQAGYSDCVLTGGVEAMSHAPYMVPDARWGARLMDKPLVDAMWAGLHAGSFVVKYPKDGPLEWARGKPYIMGLTAEFLANKWKITRQEADEVAVRSHNNAENATKNGRFADEIIGIPVASSKKGQPPTIVDKDEHFRPGMTMDIMSHLDPVFIPKIGTVTAGNASGINDGAASLLVMEAGLAKQLGLEVLAKFEAFGKGGCAPEYMGESPVPAVEDLYRRSGLKTADIDLWEVNEAFAAQYLACEKGLGIPREKANVNGSGIGLGHPVGCTGARIVVSLIHEMRKRGLKRGLATMCGGGGVSLAATFVLP